MYAILSYSMCHASILTEGVASQIEIHMTRGVNGHTQSLLLIHNGWAAQNENGKNMEDQLKAIYNNGNHWQ